MRKHEQIFYLVVFMAVLESTLADLEWKDSNLQGSGMSIRILRRDGGQNGGILNSDGEPKRISMLGQHYRDYKRDGQHLRVLKRDGQDYRVFKRDGPDGQHHRVLKRDGPDGEHDKIYIRVLKRDGSDGQNHQVLKREGPDGQHEKIYIRVPRRVGQQYRILKRNGETCLNC